MLQNIKEIESLRGLARGKNRSYITKTIQNALVDEHITAGWKVQKKNKSTTRVFREKLHGVKLEDRVWMLLYRMGFSFLSGENGAKITLDPKDSKSPTTQIDVVGIDTEISLAVECKSAEKLARRPQFQEEMAKHALIRARFSNSVNLEYPNTFKRQSVLVMFTSNIILSDNDKKRAATENVILFDERDLSYYESLVEHIGSAAKYQFFSDMIPGKSVPGLEIRIPAIRAKMGGTTCYTFSISPEYLLKIAYVSHRAKGKASDVNTYQRMLSRSRMTKIKQYISEDGIFPTNIVLNFDKVNSARFERVSQDGSQINGVLGWLTLKAAYKSAWIIDGQHRLYAYSGHLKAERSLLSVLAFEGLPPSKQAELFIDINAKQKSVKQSLLQELYAELHWDAEKPLIRVGAIISKVIQALDLDQESPFFQRILKADESRSPTRCISLASIFSALEKTGFFYSKEKQGEIIDPGPFWVVDSTATFNRTVFILKNWFNLIANRAEAWWALGSGDGGGLSMNDGITVCINVLRSVFQHFESKGHKLVQLDSEDLFELVSPYGVALANYFASLSLEERKRFRELRGIQGQTTATRRCQQAIQAAKSDFNPSGLKEFLDLEKAQTNTRAKSIIDRVEITLQSTILEELRRELGSDDSQWWILGVPKQIRKKVMERFEEEDGKRGSKEYYFDLIDYRSIAINNWPIFENILAYGKSGNKEKRTSWITDVNEIRKIVSHASASMSVTLEQLSMLETYENWLTSQSDGNLIESDDVNE